MSASDDRLPPEALLPAEASVPDAVSDGAPIALTIKASSPLTELRLLNARFEPVRLTSNAGSASVDVQPGLYEAGFRTPAGWTTIAVLAKKGLAAIEVDEPVEATPAPLSEAPDLSVLAQSGGPATESVLLTITAAGSDTYPAGQTGVSLVGEGDEILRGDPVIDGASCTWRFVAQPGHWRLRFDEAGLREPYELPLTVVANFRMVVGAVGREIDNLWHVDLCSLRIRMAANGADADAERVIQLEEAALVALESGQRLYGDAIEKLLAGLAGGKQVNPMLGLLAAHLSANLGEKALDFRQDALDRLQDLLNHKAVPHPDLAVLRLHLRIERQLPVDAIKSIAFPPLLAASWRMMLDIARTYPALIPVESLTDLIADRLWPSPLWVVWTGTPLAASKAAATAAVLTVAADEVAPAAQPVAAEAVKIEAAEAAQLPLPEDSFAAQSQQVAESLGHSGIRDLVRGMLDGSTGDGGGVAWNADTGLTPTEAAIANAIRPIASSEEHQDVADRVGLVLGAAIGLPGPAALSQALGLPDATVMRSMQSLADKMVELGKRDQ